MKNKVGDKMYSLDDVIRFTGLSRSQIDKYENACVVKKPQGKGTHSPTLYDDEGLKQLFMCRLYHELGYNIPDICRLKGITVLDGNNYPIIKEKKKLKDTVEELKAKKRELERLITIAEFIDEGEVDLSIIFDWYTFATTGAKLDYNQITTVMKAMIDSFVAEDSDLEEEETGSLEVFNPISDLLNETDYTKESEIQHNLLLAFNYFKENIIDSLRQYHSYIYYVLRSEPFKKMIVSTYDSDRYEKVAQIFEDFFNKAELTELELNYTESLKNIILFAQDKYTVGSAEVQRNVKYIYDYLMGNHTLSESERYDLFKKVGAFFGSKDMAEVIDRGNVRGFSWFISKAIEYFCINLEKSQKN